MLPAKSIYRTTFLGGYMAFDVCEHKLTQLIIKAGTVIRQLKGLPEEKNITILYNETAPLLGIPIKQPSSREADHLPSPSEMKDDKGAFILPRKDCPKCGKKDSFVLSSICPSCKDSDVGKFKSGWKCDERTGGCGYIGDKSEKFFQQRMKDEYPDIEIPNGSKLSLGIRTITDTGLK